MSAKPTGLRVEFYRDVKGEWRWTQYARNGKIRKASSESFVNRSDAYGNFVDGANEALIIIEACEVYEKSHSKLDGVVFKQWGDHAL
jgi:hypothetical protein